MRNQTFLFAVINYFILKSRCYQIPKNALSLKIETATFTLVTKHELPKATNTATLKEKNLR